MKPTAYLITCDRYLPSLSLPDGLDCAMRDRGESARATPLYSAEQIGQALMGETPSEGSPRAMTPTYEELRLELLRIGLTWRGAEVGWQCRGCGATEQLNGAHKPGCLIDAASFPAKYPN